MGHGRDISCIIKFSLDFAYIHISHPRSYPVLNVKLGLLEWLDAK